MKIKKIHKTLVFKKETVVDLNNKVLHSIYGGTGPESVRYCEPVNVITAQAEPTEVPIVCDCNTLPI